MTLPLMGEQLPSYLCEPRTPVEAVVRECSLEEWVKWTCCGAMASSFIVLGRSRIPGRVWPEGSPSSTVG